MPSKQHAVVDGTGRPLAFCLSLGNVADITVAPALLASTPLSRQFPAGQAYEHAPCASVWLKGERSSCDAKSGAVRRSSD
jgi:hypothetical protein